DAAEGGPSELRAIIPGRVVSVDVAEGDTVEPGRRLLVLEAMKMQNELRAPRAGTVARSAVGPGQTVEAGDLLLGIEWRTGPAHPRMSGGSTGGARRRG